MLFIGNQNFSNRKLIACGNIYLYKIDQAFIRDTRRYKSRIVGAFSVYYYFLDNQNVDLDELRKIRHDDYVEVDTRR